MLDHGDDDPDDPPPKTLRERTLRIIRYAIYDA